MKRSRSGASGACGSTRSTSKYSVTRISVADRSPPICPSLASYTICKSLRRIAVASLDNLSTFCVSIIADPLQGLTPIAYRVLYAEQQAHLAVPEQWQVRLDPGDQVAHQEHESS